MNDISARYGKNVLVVETSIGYTTDTLGCKGIVYSEKEEEATGYPATQEGQEQFLRDLMATQSGGQEDRGMVCLLGTRMAPDSGLYLGEHERKSVYAGKNGSRQRHGEYGII